VDSIRVIGRNTQGVKLINLGPGDSVMDVARVVNEDEPLPIETGDVEGAQEVVDSTALEAMLDVAEDEEGEEAPEPFDDLVDELTDDDGGPDPDDVTDLYGGEDES
jgi:DNA gyrase subunit A